MANPPQLLVLALWAQKHLCFSAAAKKAKKQAQAFAALQHALPACQVVLFYDGEPISKHHSTRKLHFKNFPANFLYRDFLPIEQALTLQDYPLIFSFGSP
jgi:hypothetical protein